MLNCLNKLASGKGARESPASLLSISESRKVQVVGQNYGHVFKQRQHAIEVTEISIMSLEPFEFGVCDIRLLHAQTPDPQ